MPPRSSLDKFKRDKHAADAGGDDAGAGAAADSAPPEIRTTTLRLTGDAWRQLRMLAVEQDCSSHDLLIDGLNQVFAAYGKPQIAKRRPNVRAAQRRRHGAE